MTHCSQTRKEATELMTPLRPRATQKKAPKPLSQKKPTLLGTWNVKTLRETERCAQAVREMNQYHLTLLGMCEDHWNSHGETQLQTGEIVLYSGKDSDDDRHEAGVGLLLSKHAAKSLIEWEPVSDCIITAQFVSRFQNVSIVMCYAPTNNAEEDDKGSFYAELQSVVDKVPGRDMLTLMGEKNAKVGSNKTDREREVGRHGLGDMNENGEMLADFCALNNLVIGGTLFPHHCQHKATWISPDHQTENQIDHIIIRQRWRTSLQDVRARRGADIGSDHHLVIAKLKVRLSARKRQPNPRVRFNVGKFRKQDVKQDFKISLYNPFEVLQTTEENTIEDTWTAFKEAMDTRRHLGKGGRNKEGKAGHGPSKNTTTETDSFSKIQGSGKRRQEAAES